MAKRRRKSKVVKRRRASSRASAASPRAIEAALAGIAHDIRTPLTGIVALAELLATSDLGAREREWANAVKSGADHLAALATLIVDAAKADAKGLVLRSEPFSPRALGEAVGIALAARANNKAIKSEVSIARDVPAMVSADVLRLRAALENLADNAVKFTHEGTVTFTVSADPAPRRRTRLIFTFADSGIGMSASDLKHLFRPFAQASADIAKRYGGAGLGLSFVKRIAKAMGGDLTVTSSRGRGSRFQLTILAEPVDAPGANRVDPRPVSTRSLSILCAEDNPYGRVVMNTILRELGHRVDFAETGEAAVAAVARGGYDVVLMDVMLSGLDGVEATQRIRALPGSASKTPVIGISGRGERSDEQAARAAGMNVYLAKPVSPGKLAQVLASLVA
ncbi:MAG TPA: ATP-binding protein [Pseudolabrys sp.]|jgi:CheY-like chemotaxis protein/nitrogen-specific signal transduction histidine kinase|nr:ATP-binding protein [Pseudolabrys sp.]